MCLRISLLSFFNDVRNRSLHVCKIPGAELSELPAARRDAAVPARYSSCKSPSRSESSGVHALMRQTLDSSLSAQVPLSQT